MTKGMIDESTCSVCGNFKMSHQGYCTECERQQTKISEMRKQRKRDEAFGSIWEEAGRKRTW